MEDFSGYNQIRMAEEDKIKMTFITMCGTFCYRVMPFGLKNAGATYQRTMVTLFHDMIHKEIEVYVDDMIVKSKEGEDHHINLKRLFSGKRLGFVVSERGIEVNPDKVKAIRELPPPSSVCEVRGFLGWLNCIARFIANLTDKCQPLFRLLRKNAAVEWDDECLKAFDTIKAHLIQPLVLVPLVPNRPLILYLTVRRQSLGCMLGQEDEFTHTERAIYYLSKKFTKRESNYPEIEKICFALGSRAPDPRTSKRHPETGLHALKDHRNHRTSFGLPFGIRLGLPRDVLMESNASQQIFGTTAVPEHLKAFGTYKSAQVEPRYKAPITVILSQLGVQCHRPCIKRPPGASCGAVSSSDASRPRQAGLPVGSASRPDCTDSGLFVPAESHDSLCHFSDSFLVFRG
ncbi:hypothetical protein CRG98_030064 [Punica granatum]|uniref:Reverse transcriptase domain-containing protein n=1 Tax=Punica granatum TaxID=22663 RepID=A0A2I0IZU6_PUNGR|nr:hypothetical protein CRG98_030064 [Punica granatum]